MAQVELRHAIIRIIDGHSNTGAVDDTPANGDTTLTVDQIVGIIPTFAIFSIVGSTRTYQVTGHSETMGNTTSITFTPALATADGVPINNAVITFRGRALEVTVGEGNLTYTESREVEYILDRGNLDTVREGDQVPVSVNLDFVWDFITAVSGGTPTIEDAIKQIGEAAGWTSSDPDECALYAVDLEIEYRPPCSDTEREFILLSDFRWDDLEHNIDEAQVAMTGRCNVTQASVSRAA